MNQVILVGNLSRDPEKRTTSNGTSCASFTLAVNRRTKNADGTRDADFINCTAWRQTADLVTQYLRKGSKCGVIGSLQTRTYTAQDGSKRYATDVIVDRIEFLSTGARNDSEPAAEPAPDAPTEMVPMDDGDLPF